MKKTVIDNIEYRNRNNLSCSSFECFKQTIDFKTFFEASAIDIINNKTFNDDKNLKDEEFINRLQDIICKDSNVDIQSFIIGILKIKNNTTYYNKIMEAINKTFLKEQICEQFEKIFRKNKNIDKSTLEDYECRYTKAQKEYMKRIEDKIKNLFNNNYTDDEPEIILYIGKQDKNYVGLVEDLFKDNQISSIDAKIETIKKLKDQKNRIIDEIKKYPTEFSYDLKELLEDKLEAKIYEEEK